MHAYQYIVFMNVYTPTHKRYTHTHTNVSVHTFMSMCLTHTYTNTHTHTHTHTHRIPTLPISSPFLQRRRVGGGGGWGGGEQKLETLRGGVRGGARGRGLGGRRRRVGGREEGGLGQRLCWRGGSWKRACAAAHCFTAINCTTPPRWGMSVSLYLCIRSLLPL
jgi:hypothetical protein